MAPAQTSKSGAQQRHVVRSQGWTIRVRIEAVRSLSKVRGTPWCCQVGWVQWGSTASSLGGWTCRWCSTSLTTSSPARSTCGRSHWSPTRSGRRSHRETFGATNYRPGALRQLPRRLGLITANATTPYILDFIDLAETGPLVYRAARRPDGRRRVRLLAARVRRPRRDGPGQGAGRPASRRPAGPAARHAPATALRAPGDRHERDVRVPHPRSRPEAGAGPRRRAVRITPVGGRAAPRDPDRVAHGATLERRPAARASTTGPGCTTSTSARSSTSGIGSTWRC